MASRKQKLSIEHCTVVDPLVEFEKGVKGFFLRARGIGAFLVANFGLAAITYAMAHPSACFTLVAVGATGAAALISVRKSTLIMLRGEKIQHEFAHYLRDAFAEICDNDLAPGQASGLFTKFNDGIAAKVADYYRSTLVDHRMTCTIRICISYPDGKKEYVTCGRSSGQNINRARFSEAIPDGKGIPNKFRTEELIGVFLVGDIEEAKESEDYHTTRNDHLKDIVSLMIAPINGWEGTNRVMVGMLCVGSPDKNAFSDRDTMAMKTFSDALGLAYPMIIARLAGKDEVPSKGSVSLKGPHQPLKPSNHPRGQ